MQKVLLLLIGWVLFSSSQPADSVKGSFTDERDGKTYKTVRVGNQTWMAENLNYNTSNSWCNECETYGRLYNYQSALTACASGWHLPSDDEWSTLVSNCGGDSIAGRKLQETDTTSTWYSPSKGATNETGFTALLGGCRDINGKIYLVGGIGLYWSSSERNRGSAWDRGLLYNYSNIYRFHDRKKEGLSVRCIKD